MTAVSIATAAIRTLNAGDMVGLNKRNGFRVIQVGEVSTWLEGPRGALCSLVQSEASGRWYLNSAGRREVVETVRR